MTTRDDDANTLPTVQSIAAAYDQLATRCAAAEAALDTAQERLAAEHRGNKELSRILKAREPLLDAAARVVADLTAARAQVAAINAADVSDLWVTTDCQKYGIECTAVVNGNYAHVGNQPNVVEAIIAAVAKARALPTPTPQPEAEG
jgi:hypothetical protein